MSNKDETRYVLHYGTFWIWADEKPSLLKRIYCYSIGTFLALWPLWGFALVLWLAHTFLGAA